LKNDTNHLCSVPCASYPNEAFKDAAVD